MKTLTLNKYGTNHPMTFTMDSYVDNGNLYVGLVTYEDGYPEPWSDLTVNLGVRCKANCAFIDINNNGNEIIEWLYSNSLGHLTGRIKASGFCSYPEFEFNMEKLCKYSDMSETEVSEMLSENYVESYWDGPSDNRKDGYSEFFVEGDN